MRFRHMAFAFGLAVLLNANPGLAAETFNKSCTGTQARSDGAGYTFDITFIFKDAPGGSHVGSAEFYNTTNNRSFEGEMKDIVITPEKVAFTLTYVGGGANGDVSEIELARFGDSLRGTGLNKSRGSKSDIDVKCK